jgi:predicted short-subunit dehydrogenase-like oxidoreductase (DUF2520 family)
VPSPSTSAIAIIGAGRLGTALGRVLRDRGANVVAIASRNPEYAQRAAQFIGVQPVNIERIPALASRVIISVNDDAIASVAGQLRGAGFVSGPDAPRMALHTSGSRGPEELFALAETGVSTAALHPLQTIPSPERGVECLPGSFFGLCGGATPEAVQWASEIIVLLNGTKLIVQPEHWALYHAGAVFASNYLMTMLDAALEALEIAGIPRDQGLAALAPISRASLENVLRLGPDAALTGPIARGDHRTLERNLDGLAKASAQTQAVYRAVGLRTIEIARRRGLDPHLLRQLERALKDE